MHIFGNGFNHLLDQHPMTSVPSKNRGWFVVFAGHLARGRSRFRLCDSKFHLTSSDWMHRKDKTFIL
jgi:hypothetical protein